MSREFRNQPAVMAAALAVLAFLLIGLSGCIFATRPGPAVDSNPPSVSIVGPTAGEVVRGSITLETRATDDVDLATVEYSIDGGPFSTLMFNDRTDLYEAVIDTTTLYRGVHHVTIHAFDAYGNSTLAEVRILVDNPPSLAAASKTEDKGKEIEVEEKTVAATQADGQAPTINVLSPEIGTVVQGMVTLAVKASDESGISTVEYSLDGNTFEPLSLNVRAGLYEATIDTRFLGTGIFPITVLARDDVGNTALTELNITVNNPPRLDIANTTKDLVLKDEFTLQVRASDGPDLSAVEYQIDGGKFEVLKLNSESGYYEASISAADLRGGSHFITVRAVDKIGQTTQARIRITVDNEPPKVTLVNLVDGAVLRGQVALRVRASDDIGIATVGYSLDNGVFRSLGLNGVANTFEGIIDTTTLKGGRHSISFRVTDGAGQSSQIPITILVDNAPNVEIIRPDRGVVAFGAVALSVRATDDTGLKTVEYALDGGVFKPLSFVGEADTFEAVIDTTILDAGAHSILVRATDLTQNFTQVPITIFVDNLPNVDVITPTEEAVLQGILHLQVQARDDALITEVQYSLDGGRFVPLVFNIKTESFVEAIDTTSLAGGIHSITIHATDDSGNTAQVTRGFTVDNPPSLEILFPRKGDEHRKTFRVAARASDDLSLETLEFAVAGGDFEPLFPDEREDIFDAFFDASDLRRGTYVVTVRAIDSGGHVVEDEVLVKVDNRRRGSRRSSRSDDDTPIAVDNPPVVEVVAPLDGAVLQGTVTLQVLASDDNSVTEVEFALDDREFESLTLNDGTGLHEADIDTTALDEGNHSIMVRATDSAGQTTGAQISVTVDNPSTVSILSPVDLLVVAASVTPFVTLQVEVSRDIESVGHKVDGIERGPLSPTGQPGIFVGTIDITGLAGGAHTIVVCGNDSTGQKVAETEIELIVDNQAPEVSLFTPIPLGAVLGSSALVQVNASDVTSGVENVEWQTVVVEPPALFHALEIFPPEGVVAVPVPLHPNPIFETTETPVSILPDGTIAGFVFPGAVVTSINADGEWEIEVGAETFFVYTSTATEFVGEPGVGSIVKIVAVRTLEPGPLVAELIRSRDSIVNEAEIVFLLSGVVTRSDNDRWTVGGVDFALITDPEPTAIELTEDPELGLTVVVMEFVVAPEALPGGADPDPAPEDPITVFGALEIFPPEGALEVPVPLHPDPVVNTAEMPIGILPDGTIALFVFPGAVVTSINADGEWEIEAGGETFLVYTSTATEFRGLIGVGSIVKVLAVRTIGPGPLVAELIRVRNSIVNEVETVFLFGGVVTRADDDIWTVGDVDFALVTEPEPTSIELTEGPELGVTVVVMEFIVLVEGVPTEPTPPPPDPDPAAWQDLTLNESTGFWEVTWQVPVVSKDSQVTLFVRATDGAGNVTVSAFNIDLLIDQFGTLSTDPVLASPTTAPGVRITSPLDDSEVSGFVTVSAIAHDYAGTTVVKFFVDDVRIGTASTAPYEVEWDTTTVADGVHALTAKAFDAAGNVGEPVAVNVTVANVLPAHTTAPGVRITSPTDDSEVSGSVTVSAITHDYVGTTVVKFSVDDVRIGSASAAPFEVEWDTTTVADGVHALTAKAFDAAGNVGESAAVNVTVANSPPPEHNGPGHEGPAPDTTAPVVTITSPADGDEVSGSATVSADAADDVGVAEVQFFVGDAPIGTASTTPFSVAWDTTTVADGEHSLTAKAFDAAGNVGETVAVNVTVANVPSQDTSPPPETSPEPDTTAPLATITSPADGDEVSGSAVVDADATDDVGVAEVQFFVGDAPIGTASKTPFSVEWDTTTVGDGEHSLTAKAFDAAGNVGESAAVNVNVANVPSQDTSPPAETSPEPDTAAPVVTITSPADGDEISGSATISADATDDVGVAEVQFFVGDAPIGTASTAPFSVEWDTTTVADGEHSLTAKAFDAAGNVGESVAVKVTVANAPPTDTVAAPPDDGNDVQPADDGMDNPLDDSSNATSTRAFVGVVQGDPTDTVMLIAQGTGEQVTINVSDGYVLKTPGGPRAGALEDGARVVIKARLIDSAWVAVRVLVKPTHPKG